MTQTELDLLASIHGRLTGRLTAKELAAYLLGQHAGLAYAVIGHSYSQHRIRVNLDKVKRAIQKLEGNDA